jgi:hypothetical protein
VPIVLMVRTQLGGSGLIASGAAKPAAGAMAAAAMSGQAPWLASSSAAGLCARMDAWCAALRDGLTGASASQLRRAARLSRALRAAAVSEAARSSPAAVASALAASASRCERSVWGASESPALALQDLCGFGEDTAIDGSPLALLAGRRFGPHPLAGAATLSAIAFAPSMSIA